MFLGRICDLAGIEAKYLDIIMITLLKSYLNTYIDTHVFLILYKEHCFWNSVGMVTRESVRIYLISLLNNNFHFNF